MFTFVLLFLIRQPVSQNEAQKRKSCQAPKEPDININNRLIWKAHTGWAQKAGPQTHDDNSVKS